MCRLAYLLDVHHDRARKMPTSASFGTPAFPQRGVALPFGAAIPRCDLPLRARIAAAPRARATTPHERFLERSPIHRLAHRFIWSSASSACGISRSSSADLDRDIAMSSNWRVRRVMSSGFLRYTKGQLAAIFAIGSRCLEGRATDRTFARIHFNQRTIPGPPVPPRARVFFFSRNEFRPPSEPRRRIIPGPGAPPPAGVRGPQIRFLKNYFLGGPRLGKGGSKDGAR